METPKDKYIEENRGFITASKLKEFMKSPEQYFLKYVKECSPLDKRDKKHFKIGTAIDDFISYGENAFYKKYFIDEGLKKADLEEKLEEMGIDTKGLKVDDMKALVYGDISEKIRLTPGEGEEILGCVNELQRQTLFDAQGCYDCQKTFIGKYKSLQLKGTLDRIKEFDKKDSEGLEGMIRDTKSTANIQGFYWDWKKLGYHFSMCFYWVLVWKATGKRMHLMFDVVQKTFPHPSRILEIPTGEIETMFGEITEALDSLDFLTKQYEETKDESIWLITQQDFGKLISCDMYPIMKTAIQKEIEYLQ